jgi:hypothetical protein
MYMLKPGIPNRLRDLIKRKEQANADAEVQGATTS